VDAAGECVACKAQKQGRLAKTAHVISCPKNTKRSGGSSSLATKIHGPAVGGDESVSVGTPPQSSAATVAPNVATGSGSFHPISDEDDEHLFGEPFPTAVHANAASCSNAAVSEPVAGASYRAVSEARPRAVSARKTTQLTLYGERVSDPSTLSTATAAASEPSSTASAAPSEPQGAPIAASSPIAAAPPAASPAAPPSVPPAAPPADEQPVLDHGLPVWAVSQLHFDTVNELAHVQSDGCSSPHKIAALSIIIAREKQQAEEARMQGESDAIAGFQQARAAVATTTDRDAADPAAAVAPAAADSAAADPAAAAPAAADPAANPATVDPSAAAVNKERPWREGMAPPPFTAAELASHLAAARAKNKLSGGGGRRGRRTAWLRHNLVHSTWCTQCCGSRSRWLWA
jgi:hypothetical protein